MASPYTSAADSRAAWWPYWAWGALIWSLGLTPAASALVSQRTFNTTGYQQSMAIDLTSGGGLARYLDLVSDGFVFALCGAGIALVLAPRRAGLPKAALGLWLGAMLFACSYLISARMAAHPDLSRALLGLPVVLTAVYLLPPIHLGWFVKQTRSVLLVYAYGSLLAALVAPGWAVESPYTEGVIPGFDVRLHGLTSHANFLAPLLLTYLILNWIFPIRSRWGNVHQVVVLLALVMAQSKTVWILLVLAYLIRLAFAQTTQNLPALQRYSLFTLFGAAFSGGVLYLATGPAWVDGVQVFLSQEDLVTLTGRTLVWKITLGLWESNPWFGYGPSLWDVQMRLSYAPVIGFVPAHAHNQVVQTLGESGVMGLAGLSAYMVTLLIYSVGRTKATSGVALALVMVLLLRGFSEPSFHGSIGDTNFFILFVTFAFLVLASRQVSVRKKDPVVPREARRTLPVWTGSLPGKDGVRVGWSREVQK